MINHLKQIKMKMKTRVKLVEQFGDDFYSVEAFKPIDKVWLIMRVFSFGNDGTRTKQDAEAMAIEYAKQLENRSERKETIVYETPDTSPSLN